MQTPRPRPYGDVNVKFGRDQDDDVLIQKDAETEE